MRFDLKINQTWVVIDARSGLKVPFVLWVDDATHEVAQCSCACKASKAGTLESAAIQLIGATPDALYAQCDGDDIHSKPMPKVKIDMSRKTVLVNVDDTVKDEPADEDTKQAPRRQAVLLILERVA